MLSGRVILVKLVHQKNIWSAIRVTPFGIFIRAKLAQFWNAPGPILVTESGSVTSVRPQPENASNPILVRLVGNLTLVKPKHPQNAWSPMRSTLLGMLTLVRPWQKYMP